MAAMSGWAEQMVVEKKGTSPSECPGRSLSPPPREEAFRLSTARDGATARTRTRPAITIVAHAPAPATGVRRTLGGADPRVAVDASEPVIAPSDCDSIHSLAIAQS